MPRGVQWLPTATLVPITENEWWTSRVDRGRRRNTQIWQTRGVVLVVARQSHPRQTLTNSGRQTWTQADEQIGKQTLQQKSKQANREAYRQTDRQTHRQTCRHSCIPAGRRDKAQIRRLDTPWPQRRPDRPTRHTRKQSNQHLTSTWPATQTRSQTTKPVDT